MVSPYLELPVRTLAQARTDLDRERFHRVAGHLRVNGKPLVSMPWCVTPEAEALRRAKEATRV